MPEPPDFRRDHPNAADPLSEVFSLLELRSAASHRLEAGGEWALSFSATPLLKFNAVLRGGCWIALPGEQPCRLEEGDTFLLAGAPSFVLSSGPVVTPEDGSALFARSASGIVRYGGGEVVLTGGGFTFGRGNADLLLGALPMFMHIARDDPAAVALRGTLDLLDAELGAGGLGSSMLTRHLADILLVQTLRAYVAQGGGSVGWLGALGDLRIGNALRMMHGDVRHDWSVGELARAVGMSRSGFALRFKTLVGSPPLDYLLRWRMQLAREALQRGECSVGSVAARLGYASESAFGHAFRRVHGQSPKRYWTMRHNTLGSVC